MVRLSPTSRFDRPLSISEYYLASLGTTAGPVKPVDAVFIFEGDGPDFHAREWREALDRAAAKNPGSRIRLIGHSWFSRWTTDAPPPLVRIVDRTDWHGMSGDGGEFFNALPISIENGPVVELTLVNQSPRGRLVILRTPHAVMDGRGALHFLAEIFRALRGEPLLGSNAPFSDAQLMRQFKPSDAMPRLPHPDRLTGPPDNDAPGDEWRRITLRASGRNIVSRIADATARYTHRHSDGPALFGVAVDLRRHVPGLISTANFFGVPVIPLHKGESAAVFRERLANALERRMECHIPPPGHLLKLLPRRWIDRLLARHTGYNPRKPHIHTLGISNLGRIDTALYSFPGFAMRSCFVIPLQGTNVTIMGVDDRLELAINIPKAFAGNGRFDAFEAHLTKHLTESDGQ